MPVSIKDIARIAGVSHSTVSRALRNSPLIPEQTAARIQKIAKEAGYTASAVARGLVTRKTDAVGVVVTSIADPFNGEVVAGIEDVANRLGYSVILATSQADPDREMSVVRSFRERRLDGVLVASSRVGALYIPLLNELEIPVVLINNQHPSKFLHSISIDNTDGGYQATRHLVKLGHSSIAYLGDESGLQSDVERYEGYKRALVEAGLPLRKDLGARGDGKPDAAFKAASELLGGRKPPSAIFCYNDMSALGVMQAAAKRQLSIPDDLSIVGFDDIFFAERLDPPLTTVHQPQREIGRSAMELLVALLKGEDAEKVVTVRGQLIVRGSTSKFHKRPHQAI